MLFKKPADFVVIFFLVCNLVLSIICFRLAREWVGKEFPGFLLLENNVVGAFNQFEWEGSKQGLAYHDYVQEIGPNKYLVNRAGDTKQISVVSDIFDLSDFFKVFCLPFFSGLLFCILSLLIYWFMRGRPGALPFYFFNLCVGIYLLTSFDFHTRHSSSFLFLLNFSFMPAFMTHFALVYPEKPRFLNQRKYLFLLPYLLSALVFIPYVTSFFDHPLQWPFWEGIVIAYAAFSYLFWIVRLLNVMKFPQHEQARLIAHYMLSGQLLAFFIPLVLAVDIFVFKGRVPLNWATPITVIFPLASLFGLVLGKLKQTQIELVQSEKMASLGQLLAGVAHEINNPTTFIYSNISPLKDYLSYLKNIIPRDAEKFRETMSSTEVLTDLEALTANIKEGAERTARLVSDLRMFSRSDDTSASSVNILESIQSTLNILKHSWEGRIAIAIDCPSSLTLHINGGQIAQVWMNLLSNAIQAISGEGKITIVAKETSQEIEVAIRDSGCGIGSKTSSRIFDPFFTTKAEGTGLGLSIVGQIIKKWGGQITVKSELGKGSEFVVRFPSKV